MGGELWVERLWGAATGIVGRRRGHRLRGLCGPQGRRVDLMMTLLVLAWGVSG